MRKGKEGKVVTNSPKYTQDTHTLRPLAESHWYVNPFASVEVKGMVVSLTSVMGASVVVIRVTFESTYIDSVNEIHTEKGHVSHTSGGGADEIREEAAVADVRVWR